MVAGCILTFQVVGGVISGSLALLADSGHVATDMSAILVSIAVAEYARIHATDRTARNVGFVINVCLLILVAIVILYEAFERLHEQREVTSWIMLVVATLGGIGNWIQHKMLEGDTRHKTGRVLNLHVLSDLMTSVGVVAGGIVIWFTSLYWVDTALSFCIAVWILAQVVILIRNPDGHHH